MKKENEMYGKEIRCKCGNHKFRILLNYMDIPYLHFEIVCLNCNRAFLIFPNKYKLKKYLKNTEWEYILKNLKK